jgi:hypothetical protein
MEERKIKVNHVYRHFKGHYYNVVGIAEHSETGECLVVYQALSGDNKMYVRPYEMFAGKVDGVYRFEETGDFGRSQMI